MLVDAEGQTVGRLATRVANILRGKTKPCYTPHVDCGDNVIIINAEKVVFSGKKETDKIYQRYTGYPGGQRETTPAKVRATHPERILEHAIRGMLPKNRLGDALYRNLYVYAGSGFRRTASATPSTATSMCMPAASIPTRARTPKPSTLTK